MPEETVLREILETMRRNADDEKRLREALVHRLTNGGASAKAQAWAPVFLSFAVFVFAGVSWFPRTEGSLSQATSRIERLERDLATETEERKTLGTWQQKLINNLSAQGISVDPVTAEITVYRQPRKGR